MSLLDGSLMGWVQIEQVLEFFCSVIVVYMQ